MHCSECGTAAPVNARYCPKCGHAIAGAESVARSERRESRSALPHAETGPAGPLAQPTEAAGDDVEKDLWEGGFSSRAMVGHWFASCVAAILLVVAALFLTDDRRVWMALVAVILLMWLAVYLLFIYRRLSVHYALSNQRFIHQAGILRRVTDRVELIDMDDITFEQGVLDRLVGVGSIRIVSSDRTHPELVLRGIANVGEVAQLIDDTRRAERRKRGLHIEAI